MDHRRVVAKIIPSDKPEGIRRGKRLEDVERNVQRLSRKYPAILNISRTIRTALM
jgi:hypothetical protein